MHWYRSRPHDIYWQEPAPVEVQHILTFAYCCKITGYATPTSSLCHNCYITTPGSRYLSYVSHYVFDGYGLPTVFCERCFASLITMDPLHTCQPCTRTLLNFLSNHEDYIHSGEVILLHVGGHDLFSI